MTNSESDGQGSSFWILRAILFAIGAALAAWALSDDTIIGGGVGFGMMQALVAALGAGSIVASLLPAPFASSALLLLISVLVSAVIIEIVLNYTARARYFSAFEFDERAIFKLRPGATREFTHLPANSGETLVYRVNSDGYRGPELLPDTGQKRIVVYGDSFIQAEFTRQEHTFPAVLQTELSELLNEQVEVVNAGVAGYGPDQILRRMESDLERLEPDFVVFAVFSGNDFGDLLRNRLYKIGDSGVLLENEYQLSPDQQRQVELNRNELVLIRVLRDTLRALRGNNESNQPFDPNAWIDFALEQHLREYREYVKEGSNTTGTFAVDPYSVDIAAFNGQDSAVYKIDLMALIIEKIVAQLESRNIPFHAVVIPHPMDVLDGNHASGQIDRVKYPEYDPSRLSESVQNIYDNLGIQSTNLYRVFKDMDVNDLYLKGGDDHWNENGQRVAAEEIATKIAPRLQQ